MARSTTRIRHHRLRERERRQEAAHREASRIERTAPREWFRILTGTSAGGYLKELSLPCCVIPENDHGLWRTIWTTDRSIIALEIRNGHRRGRTAYNNRCLEQVARTRRPLVGSYGGFFDVFVPILKDGVVVGHLASGPFSKHDLSEQDIRERWRWTTGGPALSSDPELLRYASVALDTPVLGRSALLAHTAFLVELARALAGTEDLAVIRARHRRIHRRIRRWSQFSAMWRLARGLTDPATQGFWSADFRAWYRDDLGLSRLPNVVIAVARRIEHDEDPLQALVASRRFAEQCSDAAFGFEDTICGRAGESTPYLLTWNDPALGEARARAVLRRTLDRIRSLLERSAKVEIHFGVSQTAEPRGLPRCLDEAIVALEWAAHERLGTAVYGEEAPKQAAARPMIFRSLGDIRSALRGVAEASIVPIAIERLMGEVVWRSGRASRLRAPTSSRCTQRSLTRCAALGLSNRASPRIASGHFTPRSTRP